MPELEEKPDLQFINNAHQHLEDLWNAMHGTAAKMDALINRTFEIWPSGVTRPIYRPSTPTSTVSNAANRLLAFKADFHRPHASNRQTSMDFSDDIEKAVGAIWRDSGLTSMHPTDRLIGLYLSAYGYAIQKDMWNLSERPVEPERDDFDLDEEFEQATRAFKAEKRSFNPFERHAPHPTTVLMDMSMRPSMAIELITMPAWKVRKWTQGLRKPDPNIDQENTAVTVFEATDPFENIDLMFYWSKHWTALASPPKTRKHPLKEGKRQEMLYVLPNTFGFVPFSHAFSGMGYETTMNIGDPDAFAVGILRSAEDSFIKQAQALTALHNILQRDAFAPYISTREPEDVMEALMIGVMQGDANDIGFFPTLLEKMTSAISHVADVADRDIELATFSRILSGFRSEGVNSVGQTQILSQAADRLFDVVASQMSHLATESAQHLLAFVDITGQSISVSGQTLSRNMIEEDHTINASFKFVDPVSRLQERQMSMAELDREIIDFETYLREARGTEDVSGVRERVAADRIRKDPVILMAEAQLTAERILDEEIQERAELIRREQEQANRGRRNGSASFPGSRPAETLNVNRNRDALTDDVQTQPRVPTGV